MIEFVVFILVGIFAGWVAEQVMKREHGLLTNLVVGVVGALIGGFLAGLLGLQVAGLLGEIIVAILGAILLLWIVGLVRKKA